MVGLLVTALLLATPACGGGDLDEQETTVSRRTCASLRERVTARALADAGFPPVPSGTADDDRGEGGDDEATEKPDPLTPAAFLEDPDAWYADLQAALDGSDLGPADTPTSVSPASRLVAACQQLGR